LLADREVALRLIADRDIDRKLRAVVRSPLFWVYSLSLWDPEAFRTCISGASAFALVGLCLEKLMPAGFPSTALTVTVIFEYFLLGLILMWVYRLGSWLYPANFVVIFTFIFRLYRKNKTMGDLSAQEIRRLFPRDGAASDTSRRNIPTRLYLRIRNSPVLGSLMFGSLLATLMVALLLLTT